MSLLASLLLLFAPIQPTAPIQVTVHADQPGHAISPSLFGVFFEEINHAGDGGLNAELVRNFNFHEVVDGGKTIPGWGLEGGAPDGTVSTAIGGLQMVRSALSEHVLGATNSGYWGISVEKGQRYRFASSCFSTAETPFRVRLLSSTGKVLAEATTRPSIYWGMVKGVLTPTESDPAAKLEVSLVRVGQVDIRSLSLKPAETWNNGGLRNDLASLVNDIHPAFVRFPGGCYVEGGDYLKYRFKWETTLGPDYQRHGHLNSTWGYWSTDALGYDEYLRWCESMGADALFVVNAGFSHKETVPLGNLSDYLNSALDALEYALGPVSSTFGSQRARNGHPAPYPLKYLEIGNENGQPGWKTGGSPEDYQAHFQQFARMIRARYPQVKLIGDTWATKGADMVDDHYYHSPDWFWKNVGLYDKSSRDAQKVYVGEYAVTTECGKGNLRAALAEAAFMTGLEHNSDLVKMASYAPLFVNVNNRAWNPDAIAFDGSKSYGTPSYYVQKLFSANRGDVLLPTSVAGAKPGQWLAVDATRKGGNEVIVKLVNGGDGEADADLNFQGLAVGSATLETTTLSSASDLDENSFDAPTKVAPSTTSDKIELGQPLRIKVPAHALLILRIKLS